MWLRSRFTTPLHLFHSHCIPAAELYDDLMELCALAQCLNLWCYGIAVYLFYSIVLLLLCLLFCVVCLGEILQLEDIAMVRLIVSHVWEEKEIAVAV